MAQRYAMTYVVSQAPEQELEPMWDPPRKCGSQGTWFNPLQSGQTFGFWRIDDVTVTWTVRHGLAAETCTGVSIFVETSQDTYWCCRATFLKVKARLLVSGARRLCLTCFPKGKGLAWTMCLLLHASTVLASLPTFMISFTAQDNHTICLLLLFQHSSLERLSNSIKFRKTMSEKWRTL